MAELRLKVGTVNAADPSTYQDGDVIEGLNDNAISLRHCQALCDIHAVPFTKDGLRDADSLGEAFLAATSEFRFTRVSATEIRRTNLFTLKEAIESMDVDAYLVRRRRHPRHRIFGTPGAEVFYGGTVETSDLRLAPVWDLLSERLGVKHADYGHWPHSPHELKTQLVIPVDDFTHEEAAIVAQPLMEAKTIVQKRVYRVPYDALAEIASKVADIRDGSKAVDVRGEIEPLVRASVIAIKPAPERGDVIRGNRN